MELTRPCGNRTGSRWFTTAVFALLAIHAVLAFRGIIGCSVTSDETGHLTAGYSYWRYNDYRLQPENGNLPQRWAAIPLLIAQPRLDPSQNREDWDISGVWNIAQRFLFESGNNTDFLLLAARTMMLCWSLSAGLLVFWWASTIWGNAAGLGALAFFVFSPTVLAHGPLVTSDMCAAVCLLAALAAWHRVCCSPTCWNVALAAIFTGLAFVAKFSATLLVPVYIGMGVALVLFPGNERRTRLARRIVLAFLLVALGAAAVIWGFYGFRYEAANFSAAGFASFYIPWEAMLPKLGAWAPLIQIARRSCILPEAFLYGFSFVLYFASGRGAFLAGNYGSTGWWWFFPFAFLVKSTIGELLATLLVAIRSIPFFARWRSAQWHTAIRSPLLPLVLFSSVYGIVSLTAKLNIGQRHVLPLYLVLFILAGGLFSRGATKWVQVLGLGAIALSAGEALSVRSHYLAFFNQLAGGPQNGWRLLVDSSLDWGQDVSALGRWVQANQHPQERVYVSCFGTADPEYEGIRGEMLAPYYSLGKPRKWFELEAGLYCISATMLQDVYGIRPGLWSNSLERDFQNLKIAARVNVANGTWDRAIPEHGFHPEHHLWLLDRLRFARLCQYLKVRKPDAVINYTQFIYRLSPAEIDAFSNHSFAALVKLMELNSVQAH